MPISERKEKLTEGEEAEGDDNRNAFWNKALPGKPERTGQVRRCQPEHNKQVEPESRGNPLGQNETDHQDPRVICGRPDENGKGKVIMHSWCDCAGANGRRG